tara:strand:+ start:68 stop:679 length:612 start_codon:yes stop_codon:yes gene_type:complete
MAETKKKKGLYSRKLKDISGDGKRNLADTYLGDLIGLDGKVGIGKKNPGIKDSLKGARREDGTTKKTAAKKTTVKKKPAPAKGDSGPDKRGKRPPALTKVKPGAGPKTRRKPTSPAAGPDKKGKRPGVRKESKAPGGGKRPTANPKAPSTLRLKGKQAMAAMTHAEWKSMTKAERRALGLPATKVGAQIHPLRNVKFKDGKGY